LSCGDEAYVVTAEARNLRFYEQHGFLIEHKGMLFGVPDWFMKRAAESSKLV